MNPRPPKATPSAETGKAALNRTWLERPELFCRDFLGLTPWPRQQEILRAVAGHNRVTVRSGHGVGKSTVAAAAVLWFTLLHDPAIVLTTAPTARQVEQVLWGEIRRLILGCKWLRGTGSLNRMEWRLGPRRFALGLSTNDSSRFQGFHSPNILVVIDEAAGVDADIYQAVQGVITSDNARLLLIGNPTTTSGFFYESHKPDSGFKRLAVSSEESPNVREGREVVPGLVTRRWVEERRAEWGEASPLYGARVQGRFPENAANALVSLAALEAAQRLEARPGGAPVLGCDVARFGDDETVIVVRAGPAILETAALRNSDLMSTAGRALDMARRHGVAAASIRIDDNGLGGGVTDRLRELGYGVTAVNAGAAASEPGLYANARAEMWRHMAAAIERGGLSLRGAPERLMADLATPTYSFTSRGQMKLEEKAGLKRRLGRSPDYGDALALTFAPETQAGPRTWVE